MASVTLYREAFWCYGGLSRECNGRTQWAHEAPALMDTADTSVILFEPNLHNIFRQ
jgi:hypothetical protein